MWQRPWPTFLPRVQSIHCEMQLLSGYKVHWRDNWTNRFNQFLSLCHVNIRSVRKNLGAFENYLNILKHEFTVIALTGTWLNDNDCDLYGLSGYKVIGRHRVNRTGGGVAVCIRDHVYFRERPDLSSSIEDFETFFLMKLKRGISKMPGMF